MIPQTVFDTYNTVADAFITDLGINCQLYYPSAPQACPNCLVDTISGRSSNQYNGTGPNPFQDTVCPYCNGEGFVGANTFEVIKMRCYFTPKHWIKIPILTKIPDGAVQTIGLLTDLPKCLKADYMTANVTNADIRQYRYKLFGEPTFHGFQRNRYFICFWSRDR